MYLRKEHTFIKTIREDRKKSTQYAWFNGWEWKSQFSAQNLIVSGHNRCCCALRPLNCSNIVLLPASLTSLPLTMNARVFIPDCNIFVLGETKTKTKTEIPKPKCLYVAKLDASIICLKQWSLIPIWLSRSPSRPSTNLITILDKFIMVRRRDST